MVQDERLSRVMLFFIKFTDSSSKIRPEELMYTPLKGGASQASLYRFEFNQRPFVLRLLPAQASRLVRMHQIRLATQAGKLKLGPEL